MATDAAEPGSWFPFGGPGDLATVATGTTGFAPSLAGFSDSPLRFDRDLLVPRSGEVVLARVCDARCIIQQLRTGREKAAAVRGISVRAIGSGGVRECVSREEQKEYVARFVAEGGELRRCM